MGSKPSARSHSRRRSVDFERDGLITREVFAEVPPRVEYTITALGSELLDNVAPLWLAGRASSALKTAELRSTAARSWRKASEVELTSPPFLPHPPAHGAS